MDQDLAAMIGEIIEGKGHRLYGLSAINQRAHALQAAWLAEQAGCDAALITACLLHDIGHMVHDLGDDPAKDGIDDQHEELGEAWLTRWFGPEVTEPVRLHVAAKRYLCATESDYFAKLSSDSVRSLELQGGPMSEQEAAAFAGSPFASAACQLRRWDDAAKDPAAVTPPFEHFAPVLQSLAKETTS